MLTLGTAGFENASNSPVVPLAVGSALMVLVYAGGHISGGHYNPAVTWSVFLSGRDKLSFRDTVFYWAFQLAGGVLGALVSWGLTGVTVHGLKNQKGYNLGQAMGAELLYTFVLTFSVLNTATTRSQSGNSFFGATIGFSVLIGAYSVGKISGGSFNPAITFGLNAVRSHDEPSIWKYVPVYIIAELVGGTISALFFRLVNPAEYSAAKKSKRDDGLDYVSMTDNIIEN